MFNTLPSAKKKDYAKKKVVTDDKALSDTTMDKKKKTTIAKENTADVKSKRTNDEGCWICGSADHMCKNCPDRKGDIERNLFCFIYMLSDSDDVLHMG